MKGFEEYLDKMGYSWNDFDRTYEMANLIEQYADEKAKQALSIANVAERSEQLLAFKEWERNKCRLPWDAEPKEIVEQYLSQ